MGTIYRWSLGEYLSKPYRLEQCMLNYMRNKVFSIWISSHGRHQMSMVLILHATSNILQI